MEALSHHRAHTLQQCHTGVQPQHIPSKCVLPKAKYCCTYLPRYILYYLHIYMVQYDCVFAAIYNIYTYVVAWNTLIMYSTTSRRLQKGPQNISVLWGSPSRNQRRTNNYDLKQGQLCRCLAEILQMTMTSSVHLFRYQNKRGTTLLCCIGPCASGIFPHIDRTYTLNNT